METTLDENLLETKKDPVGMILPVVAVALSIYSLSASIPQLNIPSILNSILGITAGIIFFYNSKWFQILIKIWIVLQVISITKISEGSLSNGLSYIQEINYFNAIQGLDFGLTIKLNDISILFNLLPIGFILLLRFTQTFFLIGKNFKIHKFSRDNKLGHATIEGKFIRKIQLEKENKWILAKIDTPIQMSDGSYDWVLLKSKEDEVYKPGKKKYISYVRLVQNPSLVKEIETSKKRFPMVDWGLVEVI